MDSETGTVTKIYAELSGVEAEVCFTNLIDKERRLLIALDSGEFAIAVTDNGKILKKFQGHDSQITGMMYDPITSRVVSASIDGCVRVWKSEQMDEPLKELCEAHDSNLLHMCASFSLGLVCTADDNGTVIAWNLNSLKAIAEVNIGSSLVGCKLFETRPLLIVCDLRGIVSSWEVAEASMNRALYAFDAGADNIFNEAIRCFSVIEGSDFFLTETSISLLFLGTDRGSLRSYSLNETVAKVRIPNKKFNKEAFNRFVRVDGAEVRSKLYSSQQSSAMYTLKTNSKLRFIRGHLAKVTCIETIKVARACLLATLGADFHFKIWTTDLELKSDLNLIQQQADMWTIDANSYCRRAHLYSKAKDVLARIKSLFPQSLHARDSDLNKWAKYRRFSKESYITKSQIDKVMSLREIAAQKQTSQQMLGMQSTSQDFNSSVISISSTKNSTPYSRSRSAYKLQRKLEAIDETSKLHTAEELQDSYLLRRKEQTRKSTGVRDIKHHYLK